MEGAIGTARPTRPDCPGMLIIIGWPLLGMKVGGYRDHKWEQKFGDLLCLIVG
jgi:hypothetical protein